MFINNSLTGKKYIHENNQYKNNYNIHTNNTINNEGNMSYQTYIQDRATAECGSWNVHMKS